MKAYPLKNFLRVMSYLVDSIVNSNESLSIETFSAVHEFSGRLNSEQSLKAYQLKHFLRVMSSLVDSIVNSHESLSIETFSAGHEFSG